MEGIENFEISENFQENDMSCDILSELKGNEYEEQDPTWELFPERNGNEKQHTKLEELENVVHLTKQLKLNNSVVEQAIEEGNLPSKEIPLEAGPMTEPQGKFIKTIYQKINEIDLTSEYNTEKFLEGMDKINKEIKKKNYIAEEKINEITQETLQNLQ